MFDKFLDITERLKERRQLAAAMATVRTLTQSHDVLVKKLDDLLEGKGFAEVYVARHAIGLREGYQNGFNDGMNAYRLQVEDMLAAQGISVEWVD